MFIMGLNRHRLQKKVEPALAQNRFPEFFVMQQHIIPDLKFGPFLRIFGDDCYSLVITKVI